jgi:hypothetical protein
VTNQPNKITTLVQCSVEHTNISNLYVQQRWLTHQKTFKKSSNTITCIETEEINVALKKSTYLFVPIVKMLHNISAIHT